MPIYMKIAGVQGPLKYDKFTGWFDVQSLRFFKGYQDDSGRSVPPSFFFTRPSDSATARLLDLLREPMHSTPRDVLFFLLGGDSGKPPKELRNVYAADATMLSYQKSGDTDTFAFQYRRDVGTPPPSFLMSSLTQPQDWGRIQATDRLMRSGGALIA